MQRSNLLLQSLRLIAMAFMVMSFNACSMIEGHEKPSDYVDDASITNKIRADIIADKQLSVFQIHVETMHGVVQLSGFVDSTDSEARAVRLAEHVEGVQLVKDNLVLQKQ